MIVVDESIHDPAIISAIASWYRGQVLSVRRLRPATIVKDDAIPNLLCQTLQPTFVTINVSDFWRRVQADRRYCIITLELTQDQALALPDWLRRILRMSEFRSKAARMGKVVRGTLMQIEYYEADRRIRRLNWPNA